MAKFVSLHGHFTKFSWVLNKNITTSPCVPLVRLTPFESSSPSSSWPTNPICVASLTEKCFQYFFSWLSAIAPRPRVALQLPPFRCRVLHQVAGLDEISRDARDAKSPNSRKRLVLEMTLQQKILIHVWFRWWWAKDGVSYYRLPRKDCNRTWWDKSERKRYELSLIAWFSIWWLEKTLSTIWHEVLELGCKKICNEIWMWNNAFLCCHWNIFYQSLYGKKVVEGEPAKVVVVNQSSVQSLASSWSASSPYWPGIHWEMWCILCCK